MRSLPTRQPPPAPDPPPRISQRTRRNITRGLLLAAGAFFITALFLSNPALADDPGGTSQGSDTSTGGDPSGGDPSGGGLSGGGLSGGDPSGGDPGGDPSGGGLSDGDPSGGDLSGGDPSGGDPSGGDLSGGDPSGGDPSDGDPSGGGLSGVDPSGGDPSGGGLSGGDPSGGDPGGGLSGGDLSGGPSGGTGSVGGDGPEQAAPAEGAPAFSDVDGAVEAGGMGLGSVVAANGHGHVQAPEAESFVDGRGMEDIGALGTPGALMDLGDGLVQSQVALDNERPLSDQGSTAALSEPSIADGSLIGGPMAPPDLHGLVQAGHAQPMKGLPAKTSVERYPNEGILEGWEFGACDTGCLVQPRKLKMGACGYTCGGFGRATLVDAVTGRPIAYVSAILTGFGPGKQPSYWPAYTTRSERTTVDELKEEVAGATAVASLPAGVTRSTHLPSGIVTYSRQVGSMELSVKHYPDGTIEFSTAEVSTIGGDVPYTMIVTEVTDLREISRVPAPDLPRTLPESTFGERMRGIYGTPVRSTREGARPGSR